MKSLDGINGRRSIQNVTEGVITTRSNRMKFRLTRGKSWMTEKKKQTNDRKKCIGSEAESILLQLLTLSINLPLSTIIKYKGGKH